MAACVAPLQDETKTGNGKETETETGTGVDETVIGGIETDETETKMGQGCVAAVTQSLHGRQC